VSQEPRTGCSENSLTRLFAVVVIYKMRPCESSSLRTLLDSAQSVPRNILDLSIYVQDNTPGGQEAGEIPEGVRYEAAPDNPGLSPAYNRALEIAYSEGYDWLLTLDQDSILPPDFLVKIAALAKTLQPSTEIGAIVPHVTGDNRILSPFRFLLGGLPCWFSPGYVDVSRQATYALNSAATLRVEALRQIGGYNPLFPLDVSDLDLFHRLHRSGRKVFLAGDLLVHHDFSLLDKSKRMSVERYRALLLDECAFWDIYMGPLGRLERLLRLAGRICKELLGRQEADFRKLAFLELKRRLVTTRARRITDWRRWAEARVAGAKTHRDDPQSESVDVHLST
jgi:GT2 family glycosyltransferase